LGVIDRQDLKAGFGPLEFLENDLAFKLDKGEAVTDVTDLISRSSVEHLCEMMRRMLRIRLFEEKASAIRIPLNLPGALHNSIGQEAEIVGACMALRTDDYMTGNHRSHGHPIGKGAALAPLMAELFGKASGVCHGKGGSMHLAAFSVGSLGESGIVGSLMPIAVGAGLSAQLRRSNQVCLCFFGDGAANCGPFHESLNLAAIWKLPVVFLCENNGFAIFTAQTQTTSVADIAQRSRAYSMPGIVVDGQDVLAVHSAVLSAVSNARLGRGPALVEAKTYRYCEHSEFGQPEDPPPYRTRADIELWRGRDPIELFRRRLAESSVLTDADYRQLRAEVETEVDASVEFALRSDEPCAGDLLKNVYYTRE
jgi:acetoin:2,6-dichlorophenolindophenol oxidoreductase subunit alpha